VQGGIQYVDVRCQNYLDALDRFNRAKKTVRSEIGLLDTATIGAMGALDSAAKSLAIAGLAFGLAEGTVDNLGGSVLYDMEPGDVSDLVRKTMASYESALPAGGYTNRISALRALQGYVSLCLPTTIESQVAAAVKTANVTTTPGNATTGAPPTTQIVAASTIAYSYDDNATLLRNFWKPDGMTVNATNGGKLSDALRGLGLNISIPELLYGSNYGDARAKVVAALGLK
jgi:hypothetical protein